MRFTCNICGDENEVEASNLHRELAKCNNCHANSRIRGMAYAVMRHLLRDTTKPLRLSTPRKDIVGIGMSDDDIFSGEFSRLFSYTNTFYDLEPKLDIASAESSSSFRDLDFVVSGDIIEHIIPPVSAALANVRGMLKTGGTLIVTAPYLDGYETIEHYNNLHEYNIIKFGDEYIIINRRRDGTIETFQNPEFHGGPGATLELRLFGEGDLFSMLEWAGFSVDPITPDREDIGYYWKPHPHHNPCAKGRMLKAHVLVCTAV